MLTNADDIQSRLAALEASGTYRHYHPLSEAVDSYSKWAADRDVRVYMGLAQLDERMRGTAPGELTLIVGFSAGGKTLIATKMLQANAHRRIAMFSPDETRDLILVKLACADHGVSALEFEQRLETRDPEAKAMLFATTERYPNLAVYEEDLSLREMDAALDELEQRVWFGRKAEAVIYDYLDLLDGGEDARSKATVIKAWGRRRNVPLFVVHQSSRSTGKDGARPTLTAGNFGGEQQATHMVGVWRRKFEILADIKELQLKLRNPATKNYDILQEQLNDAEYDLRRHQVTVSVNLVKTKRPGSQTDEDGWDFELDVTTGRLSPLSNGDLPSQMRVKPRSILLLEGQLEAF